jgi:hypothetical protein
LDPACLLPLARIGAAVLPPGLAERVRALEEGRLDGLAAEAVRAELGTLAGILTGTKERA